MTVEEDRATPDFFIGMYTSCILHSFINFSYDYLFIIRDVPSQWCDCSCSFRFGCNSIFLSFAFTKKFGDAPRALDYPSEAEIADNHIVSDLRVHLSCIIELLCEKYLIDPVPIPLQGREEMVIHGDGTQ